MSKERMVATLLDLYSKGVKVLITEEGHKFLSDLDIDKAADIFNNEFHNRTA